MILIINIKIFGLNPKSLAQKKGYEMQKFESLNHAWLLIDNGKIKDFGSMDSIPFSDNSLFKEIIDGQGKFLLPGFIDSHTHIVFADSREEEFIMKIQGKTYEEIAQAGGGILNSAKKIAQISEEKLYELAAKRIDQQIKNGTTAIEIKSGYGLSVESELKMLRVIKELKKNYSIIIKSTFLGAHTYPSEFKNNHQAYLDLMLNQCLPEIAKNSLADHIDVFCENGFFNINESVQVCEAGARFGLAAKIHGNQLGHSGGIEVALKSNAWSIDHLEFCNDEEINQLKNSDIMPVALPNCSFFLRMPYTPARKMIDQGLALCMASDYNPGSAPSGNMQFVVSLGCIQMKLLPEEAFNAVTLNAARSLRIENRTGSIEKGKRADLILTKEIKSLAYLPYSFGENWVERVFIGND